MITNTPATIIIDGINNTRPVFKRSESEVVNGEFYVADGNGGSLGAFAFSVTDEIVSYLIKQIVLHESSVYEIRGVAIPGDATVFLSSGFQKGSIEALRNNVIGSAYADSAGNFVFNNVYCPTGIVSMWIATLAQDSVDASLTYSLSITDYDPDMGNLITHSFSRDSGEYKNPLFTITGTCSEDIEKVYLSAADNAMSITYLMETLCKSATPTNGTYEIQYGGDYGQNYIVWGVTKSGGALTLDTIVVTEDTSTCLSGDTMITMADRSVRRMDSLHIGEMVLSENGEKTRIHDMKNGYFSDYHTLYHFEDGTIIDETHPHRFYNVDQGFWQRLELWKIGEHAINQHGEKVKLMSVERLDEKVEMFGIWTDNGTYYANGLLSGAASCNKKLLEEASAEKAIDMMLSTDESWLLQLMGLDGELPL